MNRTFALPLIIAALFFSSCQQKFVIPEEPFTVEITKVLSDAVWVDIIPVNNDFHYYVGVVTVKEFNMKYGTDDKLIAAADAELRETWEKIKSVVPSGYDFYNTLLYQGSYVTKMPLLEDDTEYYCFMFPYGDDSNPEDKLMKVYFRTKAKIPTDISFSASLSGSVLTVTPTNDDTYYWDYELKSAVEKDYFGSPEFFYQYIISSYEEYGFIDNLLSKGQSTSDMSDYYELNSGDVFYLVCSGYNNGINSSRSYYEVTFSGPGLPGKVIPYSEPTLTEEGSLCGSSIPSVHILQDNVRQTSRRATPRRELW